MPDRDLLDEARRLEAKAIEAGEYGATGHELLVQAASLRVQALGARVYPVLICQSCCIITGWLSAEGQCDTCLRRSQLEAAYRDPHGGWVVLGDARPRPTQEGSADVSSPGLSTLLKRLGKAQQHALVRAWMRRVRLDETGPIVPEEGYELEVAKRDEVEAADRTGMILRFHSATHRFSHRTWIELETTKISRREIVVPQEFSAALAIEQLVEGWGDYKAAVDAFNCRMWAEQSEQREVRRQELIARQDALREQRDVMELLDED
jgi:hypothetical protein